MFYNGNEGGITNDNEEWTADDNEEGTDDDNEEGTANGNEEGAAVGNRKGAGVGNREETEHTEIEDVATIDGAYVQSRHEGFVHLLSVNILESSWTLNTFQLHKLVSNNDAPLNMN